MYLPRISKNCFSIRGKSYSNSKKNNCYFKQSLKAITFHFWSEERLPNELTKHNIFQARFYINCCHDKQTSHCAIHLNTNQYLIQLIMTQPKTLIGLVKSYQNLQVCGLPHNTNFVARKHHLQLRNKVPARHPEQRKRFQNNEKRVKFCGTTLFTSFSMPRSVVYVSISRRLSQVK